MVCDVQASDDSLIEENGEKMWLLVVVRKEKRGVDGGELVVMVVVVVAVIDLTGWLAGRGLTERRRRRRGSGRKRRGEEIGLSELSKVWEVCFSWAWSGTGLGGISSVGSSGVVWGRQSLKKIGMGFTDRQNRKYVKHTC